MRRRRGLTPEDTEIWSRVAATATPMHPETPSGASPLRPPEADPQPRKPAPTVPRPSPGAVAPFRVGQQVQHPLRQQSTAPSPAQHLAAAQLRMDPKTHKRMTRGKLRPEARMDLHGLTLAEAHPRLIQFVLSCHAEGLRLVLIITGKGRGDHGPLPTRPGALR
ncbi:MAG: Smr/MutS family protein, partial [Paracoccus sp. (in: a-proteobacteria)]